MTRTILTAALALGMALAAAYGVKPTTVTHTAEADFASGKADGVAVWSLGEVTLGPKVQTLLEGREDVDLVTALAVGADGVVYAGTAPKGLVLRIAGEGEPAVLAELDSAVIAAIRVEGARLVVATAGNAAGLYTVALPDAAPEAPVEAEPLWVDDAVTAVWGFTRLGETYYAATAPEGKLFAVRADGAEAIFTARQKALRSIAGRGTALYFGTGEDGLVYRFDLTDRDARVLLDAPQKEIVALALGGDGNLYVAATDVSGGPATPAAADVGRPERTTAPEAAPALGGDDDDDDDDDGDAGDVGDVAAEAAEGGEDEAEADEAEVDEAEVDEPAAAGPATAPALAAPGSAAPAPASAPASAPAGELAAAITRARPVDTAPSGTAAAPAPRPAPGGAARSTGAAAGEGGNRVYCIQPDGLVRVVVQRKPTLMDMALVERDGQRVVFLATAGEGQIVEARPDTGDAATVADIDPEIVTALAAGPDGALYAGTASPATVVRLAEAPADEGTLVSKPIDAEQFARWSQLRVDADVPAGAAVTIATRTGNLEEAEDDTWSSWSAELPANGAWQPIGSPAGRFLQYRLTLTPSPAGLAGTVTRLDLTRQVGNLAPEIAGIAVEPSAQPQARPGGGGNQPEGPKRYRLLRVQASDPNEDDLRFDVFARRRGTEVWIRIAKDLEEPQYAWDTQTVPDGEYEVRVVASDSPSNPPATALTDSWISRPVTVDNTGPALVELTARADMPAAIVFRGTATVTARFRDAGSRLEKVEYVVDSGETWTVLEPADGVYDTPAEQVSARITDLEHGPHLITLRAIDEYGNVTYATAEVSIAP